MYQCLAPSRFYMREGRSSRQLFAEAARQVPGFARHPPRADWRSPMLDIALIALGFAFLGGAILYVHACDRL